MSAKIVVACGSGVATSEMVAARLEKMLGAASVDAQVVAVELADLEAALADADAYVSVMSNEFATDVPTVNGVAFLTGMNADSEFKRLLEVLGVAAG